MSKLFPRRVNRISYFLISLVIVVYSSWIDEKITTGELIRGAIMWLCFIEIVWITIRRLHDMNKSGWWFLALFIPLYGIYLGLLLLLKAGDPTENRFGPPPEKGISL